MAVKGISKETERLALAAVSSAFIRSEKYRRPIVRQWNRNFRLINGITEKNSQKRAWQSRRFVPLTGMVMDLVIPRLFQGMPAAAAVGQTPEAMLNEDNLNQTLDNDQARMDLETQMNKVIKDGAGYGLGVLWDGWRTETAENLPHTAGFIAKMVSQISKLVKGFKASDMLYDGPAVRWVDPFTFGWDPDGDDMKSCAYVYEWSCNQSKYQLRKDPDVDPRCVNELEGYEANDSDDSSNVFRERMLALGYSEAETDRVYGKVKDGNHEKIYYCGAFDIDGDGIEEECIITVLDRVVVAGCRENDFRHGQKPYSIFQYDLRPGFMVGRSLVDRMAELQMEYNDATEQASDMRKLTLKPMIKYRLGSDTDPETLEIAPGMPIGVEHMDDVEWDRPPDFTPQLQAVLKETRELIQLVTGANDVALGQQDVGIGDNTATGSMIAQEQTEMRFRQPAILLDLMVQNYGNHLISNEQQFRKGEYQVALKDGGTTRFRTIRPKGIAGAFDYQMESGSLMQPSPSQKVNMLLNAYQLIQNNPNYDSAKLLDQILMAMKINPATLKQGGSGQMDQVQKFMALPPEQQQQALSQMDPEDQQLMEKAMQAAGGQPPQPPGQQQPPNMPPNGQPGTQAAPGAVPGPPQQQGLPAVAPGTAGPAGQVAV